MSFVISVQRSLPWAHGCDEDIGNSRSDASSSASIVTIVWSRELSDCAAHGYRHLFLHLTESGRNTVRVFITLQSWRSC